MGLKIGLKWSGVAVGEGQERVDGLHSEATDMQTGGGLCLLAVCFFCHCRAGESPTPRLATFWEPCTVSMET